MARAPQKARMPNQKKRPPRATPTPLVENFGLRHVQCAALIPGDPALPAGLQLSAPMVQLVLIGRPAFLPAVDPDKHYLTYFEPQTAIEFGEAFAESGREAAAGAVEVEETASGLVVGASPASVAAEAAAAAARDKALRNPS